MIILIQIRLFLPKYYNIKFYDLISNIIWAIALTKLRKNFKRGPISFKMVKFNELKER